MPLRIGLAGYGRRGRGHIRAVEEVEDAQIASVSDPIDAARNAAIEDLGDITVHTTVAEMVDSGDVDAVIIAAPAHLNGDVAMDAIARGFPVLIEKPPSLTVAGVAEMSDVANRTGSKVMVAFNRRFNPLIRTAIDVISQAGELRQIVAEFHKDIHDFTDDPRYSPAIFDLMLLESPIHSDRYRYSHGRRGGVVNQRDSETDCEPVSRCPCGVDRVRERGCLPVHRSVHCWWQIGTLRTAWRLRIGLSRRRKSRLGATRRREERTRSTRQLRGRWNCSGGVLCGEYRRGD